LSKFILGDPETIFNTIKSATKDTDGQITSDIIDKLESDSPLFKNFFTMIFTYIKYMVRNATEKDLEDITMKF
jgi:hypothetical protein